MAITITNDAASTRTNLGLGDAATKTVGTAAGNIPVLDSSGQIASGVLDNAGGGKVLQVVTENKASSATFSGTWANVTGMTASITPTSSTSKILVQVSVGSATPTSNSLIFRMARTIGGSTTYVGVGNVESSNPQASWRTTQPSINSDHSDGGFLHQFLDEPATTSSTTYQLQGYPEGGTAYFNRVPSGISANMYQCVTHSSITLMEIGA